MASSRMKADDKRAKILRELIALESNKYCFDCSQRGPTYVNMTIGAYVCTQCSGLLRGLNNPHRVKSVNIATFTPEDMEFLKARGNDLCRKVWLGLYDRNSSVPEPDPKNSQNLKDFLSKKYDSKRWYVAPSEELYTEARQANQAPFDRVEKAGGRAAIRSGVPNNSSKLIIQQPPRSTAAAAPPSVPKPAMQKIDASAFVAGPAPVAAGPPQGTANLLGDLGADPFGGAVTASAAASTSSSAFSADFSAAFSATPVAPSPWTGPVAAAPQPAPLVPSSNQPGPPPGPPAPGPQSASDKYAALAELDGLFGTAPASAASSGSVFGAPQPTAVNWSGTGFGGWSGASTSSGMAWGDASSAGTSVFGGGGGGGPGGAGGGSVNGVQAAAAPLGVHQQGGAAAVSSWSNGNPFGGGAPNKPSANPFMGNPFSGGAPQPPQWGAMPPGPTHPSPPGPPAHQNGWGMMPQASQPSHNPFLGLSSQPPAMQNQFPAAPAAPQPPSGQGPFGAAPNTTNPFL